ncbi:MAG: hypothetical protein JST14_17420 [Bacteroidetes bacterium]|nr:hypothetical protein [Bacteroidota bacterium]
MGQYVFKSWEDFFSPILGSIFLCSIYLLFESAIEDALNKYWVIKVVKDIQSEGLLIILVGLLLLIHSAYQIHSKNFSIRAFEIFVLVFYTKYRCLDTIWDFHPISYTITFFDALPLFLLLPKIISIVSFYKGFEPNRSTIGIIDPDVPLSATNPKDELNRNRFAEELVTVLKATRPSERALVIGINGAWGSGKTSLQYLIEKSLLTNETKSLFYVINFNPWFYSHSKSLSHAFLTIVRNAIKIDAYVISKSLSRYANTVIKNTESFFFKTQFLSELRSSPSLEEDLALVKARVKNLKKTLLVIIDDLDRLAGEEVIEVLRLVRLVGDFPNTIYVILYDKEYVKRVVNENLNEHNSSIYIDKIIQVEYTIPENNLDYSKQLLLNHLSTAIEKAIPESKRFWSTEEINAVLEIEQFNYFIKHLRDIKRFTNNFLLRYKSIYSEVNFKQFILLELLRYRHPELAVIIFNYKDIFLSQFASNDPFGLPEIDLPNDFWSKVVGQENTRSILKEMAKYRTELRSISDPSFFPNYFTLTLLSNFISEGEFNVNLTSELDGNKMNKYKDWIKDRYSRNMLLYRFRNYESLGSIESFINFVNHLGFVQNEILAMDRVSSGNSSEELPMIFINKYLKLSANEEIDSKTLYAKTSSYVFETGENTSEMLQSVFRSNTSFSVSGNFNGSPLGHGWKEASNRDVNHLNSIFRPQVNNKGGYFMIFDAPFDFRFDFTFESAPVFLRNSRTEIKTFRKEWAFYIKVNAFRGNEYKELFFRLLDQDPTLGKVSDEEFTVGIKPTIIDEWKVFELNLDELFRRTFASDGFTLLSVNGIGVRGNIAFGKFQLY